MSGRSLSVLVVVAFLAVCGYVMFRATKSGGPPGTADGQSTSGSATPRGPGVEITVSSSDGKKEWLEAVAKAFHASGAQVDGKPIRVKLIHMKSGESMQKILDGKEQPTLWSPAGGNWIELINTTWKTRTGHPFIEGAKPTVMSGLVLAMWEPMARALGWPAKQLGWKDIFAIAKDTRGWAAYGHPEWGPFRFGHGHPDFSTSAMLSVVSAIYAATGKTSGLTTNDLRDPKVVEQLRALERAIVHYGESSSWLTERLCTRGPSYLSAVTLYEANVVKANDKYQRQMPFRLVAIYPKDGTYWEDHPAGIAQADWVSGEQRQAADKLLAFMTAREQQALAPQFGYRPTDNAVPLAAPIDEAHGADPKQTGAQRLEYVSEAIFRRANELWHQVKKHSTVFLLLDTSGSMEGEKMVAAKRGAAAFIRAMEKDDQVAVISFSSEPRLLRPLAPIREVGEVLAQAVEGLFAGGQTALFDATIQALDEIERIKRTAGGSDRLYGIVLLSDGKDTSSRRTLSDLLDRMPATEAAEGTRIFTVAYGSDADNDLLKQLATRSNARDLKGTSENIEKVYHQISAYF